MEEKIHCNCYNVTAKVADPSIQNNINETAKVMNQVLNEFDEKEKVDKANGILNNFRKYISSSEFVADVKNVAKKYNVPEKAVATNFFEKVLGTVGDIFGIVFGTIEELCHSLINLVGAVAHGIVSAICSIANAVGRTVTLNKTAVCK